MSSCAEREVIHVAFNAWCGLTLVSIKSVFLVTRREWHKPYTGHFSLPDPKHGVPFLLVAKYGVDMSEMAPLGL